MGGGSGPGRAIVVRTGRAAVVAVVAVATGLAVVMSAGCGTGPAPPDRVRPIGRPRVPTTNPTSGPTTAVPPTSVSTTPRVTTTSAFPPSSTGGATGPGDAVDGLLDRYDAALTALAAHPEAVGDEHHPAWQAWRSVVLPGTALSEDVPAAIAARRADGRVVVPGPGGRSYRHHALEVVAAADGAVSFTWCGWSPGIGRDLSTGAVVDDGVGHAHGTGRAHATAGSLTLDAAGSLTLDAAGSLTLDALDQSDLEVLPAGSPDPCPAEARTAGS